MANKNQGSRFSDGIISDGDTTVNGSLYLPDTASSAGPNDEEAGTIYLGADKDFSIHTSEGRGVLAQQTASKDLIIQPVDGKSVSITKKGDTNTKIADFTQGSSVDLYHNGTKKFNTNSAGIQVLGSNGTANNSIANNGTVETGIIKFNTGVVTSDHASIFTTRGTSNDLLTFDFKLSDNASDYYRWRFALHNQMTPTSGATFDLMTLKTDATGNATLKVGGGFTREAGENAETDPEFTPVGTVDAETFTGQAATVAALTGLTTDNLNQGTTNKYFSTGQVDSHIQVDIGDASGAGSLSYDTGAFTFNPVAEASYTQETVDDVVTTTHVKGIASFDETDFTISSGKVSLKDIGNSHIGSSAGIAYSKMANISSNTLLGNNTNSAASATALSAANVRTLLGIATNADNYDGWNINHVDSDGADGTATKIGSTGNVKFQGAGATTITRSAGTVTITSANDDTTYTAGSDYGLTVSTNQFRLKNDRRRNANEDVKTGNSHDYIHFDIDAGMSFYVEELEEMRLENDGDLHVNGDIIGFSETPSDERLKENINTVDNALDKISQLNGVTFEWESNGKSSAGLIAQDVEKVLPSAIKEKTLPFKSDDDKKYKMVEYSQVTALLVEAIKELKEENNQLRADIEDLKVNK